MSCTSPHIFRIVLDDSFFNDWFIFLYFFTSLMGLMCEGKNIYLYLYLQTLFLTLENMKCNTLGGFIFTSTISSGRFTRSLSVWVFMCMANWQGRANTRSGQRGQWHCIWFLPLFFLLRWCTGAVVLFSGSLSLLWSLSVDRVAGWSFWPGAVTASCLGDALLLLVCSEQSDRSSTIPLDSCAWEKNSTFFPQEIMVYD